MSIVVRFEGKRRSPNSSSKAANPGGESNTGVLTGLNGMMSLLSCMTSINQSINQSINKDWLDYNQRHHITVSTGSLRKIKLWLDRLICCPDAKLRVSINSPAWLLF